MRQIAPSTSTCFSCLMIKVHLQCAVSPLVGNWLLWRRQLETSELADHGEGLGTVYPPVLYAIVVYMSQVLLKGCDPSPDAGRCTL